MKSRTVKTGILASGNTITALVGVITVAVLARLLDPDAYATYRQTFLAYNFVAPIMLLGLPHALYYFLPVERHRPRAVVLENLFVLCFMGFLFSAFLLLGGNRLLALQFDNPELVHTLTLLVPFALLVLPAASFTPCLMSRDRVVFAAIFNGARGLILLAAVVLACWYWRTPSAAIGGMVGANCLMSVVAIGFMLHVTRGGPPLPEWQGIKRQVVYSVPLGLAGMLGAINFNLDKIIVSSLCPPDVFAIFVNGAMRIPLVGILMSSASAVLLPEMTRSFKAKRPKEVIEVWKRAAKKIALVLLPCLAILMVVAEPVMRLLYSAKYIESAVPFRIYLLLLPTQIIEFGTIFLASGKSRLLLVRAGAAVAINLGLSLFLVHRIGPNGAAVATVTVLYLWSVPFSMIFIRRIFHVRLRHMLPYADMLKILIVSGIAALPALWLISLDVPDLALLALGVGSFMLLLAVGYHLSGLARNPVRQLLKLARRKEAGEHETKEAGEPEA